MSFPACIKAIIYVTLCTISAPRLIVALTSREASLFESEEIAVIPGKPDLYGYVAIGNNADGTHTLRSNGIPDHGSGADASSIREQNFMMKFPRNPIMNPQPSCLDAYSIIGFATNGIAIFSPFNSNQQSLDFDFAGSCQGRVAPGGIYYYAQVPDKCSIFTHGYKGHNATRIYGVALDGFPIYGPGYEANKVTNAQLDECHGKYVDGKYRYYMTDEWPYVLGCFRGTPATVMNPPQAPTSNVCLFPCRQVTLSFTFPCPGGQTPPQPVTQPPVQPLPNSGLTTNEARLFESDGIQVITGTSLSGVVTVTPNFGGTYTLTSNGIPDHSLRTFPNADDPYAISQQNFRLQFPQNPTMNTQPRCLPAQSIIGFATNGIPLYSPFDNNLNNLNLASLIGTCPGRVRPGGMYYYAKAPNQCSSFVRENPNGIYGIALDGFPIYGPGTGSTKVTNSELDACHGKVVSGRYGYYMTDEWPYILGCFRGTPQYVNGGPSPSGVCKFACNKNAFSSSLYCRDDFNVIPPLATSTPILPPTQRPVPSILGVTSQEATLFKSMNIQPQPVPNIVGRVSLTESNTHYIFSSNSIPDHNDAGTFPNLNNQYAISAQNFMVQITKNPRINFQPSCLPANSIIGFATNGVALFSPFDYSGNNLNLEFGNNCQGRTSSPGIYYYAQIPDKCNTYKPGFFGHNPNEIYGIALDGFPIYGPGTGLNKVTNADLDTCHGKMVNGQYRYYMTGEWPYILGCFRGTPAFVQGAPSGATNCRFACNIDSLSNRIACVNSFPIEPLRRPYLTQPVTQPPQPATQPPGGPQTRPPSPTTRPGITATGLTDADILSFTSRAFLPIPNTVGGSVIIFSGHGEDTYLLFSNGIPDHPVSLPSNQIAVQNFEFSFLKYPKIHDKPTCLTANSIIGFATNGVPIFSPFDVNGGPLTDIFNDECQEYTTQELYFYVQVPSKCETFDPSFIGRDPNGLYGVALDGFPIYGPGAGDSKITNADLDECHGKMVNGKYRYYWTDEWPYVLGCFRGSPKVVKNGPTLSKICKFACKTDSTTSDTICVDTTKAVPETLIGITDEEVSSFISGGVIDPITGMAGIAQILENDDGSYTFVSNGIPDHATGNFVDLSVQNYVVSLPTHPEYSMDPECLPSPGIIGFATNGIAIFSPYDAQGQDVNAMETDTDLCRGQVSDSGIYYYTQIPNQDCFPKDPNSVFGVAIDGFPIYGPGNPPITNEELDVCHGKIVNGQYRYYMTQDFPYTLGCFRGNPQTIERHKGRPTVPTFTDSCRYACNTNGTTPEDQTQFCDAPSHYLSLCLLIMSVLSMLVFW